MRCRHDYRIAAGGTTRRQPPRRHPGSRSERKPPATLLAHRAAAALAFLSARLSAAREARMSTPLALSVAVREKPTVRTDRPSGLDAVRYASVDTATYRPAVTRRDTRRDKKETARRARFRSQGAVSAGGGRCWVRTNVG